jgi:hypothetical protein
MAAGDAGKRKNKIDGQFVAITRAILECPARRALSLAARRALERIEIEHLVHGGKDNGKLPVTYRDFEKWLVRPDTIASAIRELVALGFVEVTRHGYGGAAEKRAPNLYRLTYTAAWDAVKVAPTGTHEYLRIATLAEAEAIAKAARKGADVRNVERGKKQNATPQIEEISPHTSWVSPAPQNVSYRRSQSRPTKRGSLSISRDDTRSALQQSAVASVSSKTAQTNEPANFTAIGILIKTRGCSFQEAAEHFEKLPDRTLEPADD